jgi:hypothetical protein
MKDSVLDHITIAADNLEQGVAYIENLLGITPPYGGDHPRMGTHNHLLRLGADKFLEIIAINPSAKAPSRSRWFDLDRPHRQAQLRSRSRLLTWVVRTADIYVTKTLCSEPLGEVEAMSRGTLTWLMTIDRDGKLPCDGIVPSLIQWNADTTPAFNMPDFGCSLVKLEGFHPEKSRIDRAIEELGVADIINVHSLAEDREPYLVAHIQTPSGIKIIN